MVLRRFPEHQEARKRGRPYVPPALLLFPTRPLTRTRPPPALYEADKLAHEEAIRNGGVSLSPLSPRPQHTPTRPLTFLAYLHPSSPPANHVLVRHP